MDENRRWEQSTAPPGLKDGGLDSSHATCHNPTARAAGACPSWTVPAFARRGDSPQRTVLGLHNEEQA